MREKPRVGVSFLAFFCTCIANAQIIAHVPLLLVFIDVGEHKDQFSSGVGDVNAAPTRVLRLDQAKQSAICFGTIGTGVDLFRDVLRREDHVFSAQRRDHSESLPNRPSARHELGTAERTDSRTLDRHPVEVLLVEERLRGNRNRRPWERWVTACKRKNRPDLVVVLKDPKVMALEQSAGQKVR